MSILSGLDAALHELGMLSAVTESRHDYLREQKQRHCIPNRSALNVLHINTRYVTSVAVGQRKSTTVRPKPYPGPCLAREERTRTKSENSDVDLGNHFGIALSSVPSQLLEVNSLHKSRSMESVTMNVSDDESASQPTQEVESVSSKIQHLQVNEWVGSNTLAQCDITHCKPFCEGGVILDGPFLFLYVYFKQTEKLLWNLRFLKYLLYQFI